MKFLRVPLIFVGISHGLSWVAFLWLAFWPAFYQGVSTTAVGPDGIGGEQVRTSASIVAINGWWVLIPLLVPVTLTAIGFLATLSPSPRGTIKLISLWVMAILLLAFCLLGLFSIGIFYVPAALALLVAAVAYTVHPHTTVHRHPNRPPHPNQASPEP